MSPQASPLLNVASEMQPPHCFAVYPPHVRAGRHAFTLIEVLVVLAIIGLLTSVAVVVGSKVTTGGQQRLTADTIRVLDLNLDAYVNDRNGKFPSSFRDETPQGHLFHIFDGRYTSAAQNALEPTIGYFTHVASEVASVDSGLKSIDSKLLSRKVMARTLDGQQVMKGTTAVQGLFVNDAWGKPIRFVVPRFHGGHGSFVNANGSVENRPTAPIERVGANESDQERRVFDGKEFSRSYRPGIGIKGEADEGLCPGNHPYFYSAGEDDDAGTRADNVYTNRPTYPTETAKLN